MTAQDSGDRAFQPIVFGRWMVAWTRPGAEFDVAEDLRKLHLAALVPAERRFGPVNRWARNRGGKFGKKETVLVPAFPRYILFAATDEQPVWSYSLDIDGVAAVVRQAGNREAPALLPHKAVEALRGPLGDGVIDDVTETVEEIAQFGAGKEIMLTSGVPGIVLGQEGRNVRVLLSLFGRTTESTIGLESIQLAVA